LLLPYTDRDDFERRLKEALSERDRIERDRERFEQEKAAVELVLADLRQQEADRIAREKSNDAERAAALSAGIVEADSERIVLQKEVDRLKEEATADAIKHKSDLTFSALSSPRKRTTSSLSALNWKRSTAPNSVP